MVSLVWISTTMETSKNCYLFVEQKRRPPGKLLLTDVKTIRRFVTRFKITRVREWIISFCRKDIKIITNILLKRHSNLFLIEFTLMYPIKIFFVICFKDYQTRKRHTLSAGVVGGSLGYKIFLEKLIWLLLNLGSARFFCVDSLHNILSQLLGPLQ